MFVTFLNFIPSIFSVPSTPDPKFAFSANSFYDVERTTPGLGVTYHVNGAQLRSHPVYGPELARGTAAQAPGIAKFESNIERVYTRELYNRCQSGVDAKERRKEREIGVFGIGANWEKVRQIEAEKVQECEELRRLGVIR